MTWRPSVLDDPARLDEAWAGVTAGTAWLGRAFEDGERAPEVVVEDGLSGKLLAFADDDEQQLGEVPQSFREVQGQAPVDSPVELGVEAGCAEAAGGQVADREVQGAGLVSGHIHVADGTPLGPLFDGLPLLCFQHEVDERCSEPGLLLYAIRGRTGFPILSCPHHLALQIEGMTATGIVVSVERVNR